MCCIVLAQMFSSTLQPEIVVKLTPKTLSPACLKGVFAKGCFLAFDVLRGEVPFALSRF